MSARGEETLVRRYHRTLLRKALRRMGLEVYRRGNDPRSRMDLENLDEHSREIFAAVEGISLTGLHRVDALVGAVKYLEAKGVPGDFVECGVWRGGSVVAMIKTLQLLGSNCRDIFMFDTFGGLSSISGFSDKDISFRNERAEDLYGGPDRERKTAFLNVSLQEVRSTVLATGYPPERLHFVEGRVEDTVPERAPRQIAFLRLDTDFYESTRHEMEHLYPRLVEGGVLLVDDYGHWRGARKAVDEYLEGHPQAAILLNRIDYSGRIGVKLR